MITGPEDVLSDIYTITAEDSVGNIFQPEIRKNTFQSNPEQTEAAAAASN